MRNIIFLRRDCHYCRLQSVLPIFQASVHERLVEVKERKIPAKKWLLKWTNGWTIHYLDYFVQSHCFKAKIFRPECMYMTPPLVLPALEWTWPDNIASFFMVRGITNSTVVGCSCTEAFSAHPEKQEISVALHHNLWWRSPRINTGNRVYQDQNISHLKSHVLHFETGEKGDYR